MKSNEAVQTACDELAGELANSHKEIQFALKSLSTALAAVDEISSRMSFTGVLAPPGWPFVEEIESAIDLIRGACDRAGQGVDKRLTALQKWRRLVSQFPELEKPFPKNVIF